MPRVGGMFPDHRLDYGLHFNAYRSLGCWTRQRTTPETILAFHIWWLSSRTIQICLEKNFQSISGCLRPRPTLGMSVIHWTGNVWFGSIYNTEIDWWPLVKSRAAHFSRVNGAEHNGERERGFPENLSLSLSPFSTQNAQQHF